MSYQELYEWYEYYMEEPFISDRLEIQMATVCQMVGSFGGSKLKHKDFMIRKQKEEKKSLEEFENDLKTKFSAFTKKVN